MKVKKILSAVLSTAMCLSIFTANVSANETIGTETPGYTIETVGEKSNDFQSIGDLNTTYRLEDVDFDLNHLTSIPSNQNNVSIYSVNSAPVAGLATMVVNPETLLNGSMTRKV